MSDTYCFSSREARLAWSDKYEDEVNAYTAERVRVTGGASGRAKTRGLHLKRIEGNARVLGDVVPGWCTSVCECSSVRV